LEFSYNNTVKLSVGDSKEGWVQALDFFFKLIYSNEYRNIKTIIAVIIPTAIMPLNFDGVKYTIYPYIK